MSPILWILVAIKIFIVFWLIYYIFERRKKKGSENNLAITEEGIVTSYAGAPVTHIPKSYNNKQQLSETSANMSANIQPSTVNAGPHPHKSTK